MQVVVSSFGLRFTSFANSFLVPQIEHINLFVYHCRFGFLNNTLKAYLYSLPVNHLSWNIKSSLQLMFDFFDILRREVCEVQSVFLIFSVLIYS